MGVPDIYNLPPPVRLRRQGSAMPPTADTTTDIEYLLALSDAHSETIATLGVRIRQLEDLIKSFARNIQREL